MLCRAPPNSFPCIIGFQVAPAELEGLLLTCPLVADCAVIGVWSEEQASELPRAYGGSFKARLSPLEGKKTRYEALD